MTQTRQMLAVAAAAALLTGCSTLEPSPALLSARSGYQALNPNDPHNAFERGQAEAALQKANNCL